MFLITHCVGFQTVENCVCTLRNLSYRLELEVPQARLLGLNELDDLLGKESPSKDSEPSCWGKERKRGRKRGRKEGGEEERREGKKGRRKEGVEDGGRE